MDKNITIRSKVWLYPGMAGWHFVSLSKKQSNEIKKAFSGTARKWGSLPVTASIRKTTWKTSIFPDSKEGVYLLPIKALIRKKEKISTNESISVTIVVKQ